MITRRCARCRRLFATSLVTLTIVAVASGAPPKRARPPKFSKAVSDVFFPNALEKLAGPRPEKASVGDTPAAPAGTPPGPVPPGTANVSSEWAQLIAPQVIEDEIKAQHGMLGAALGNVVEFKGGQYKGARARLSLLATMFAIDAQYGQPVRWQREAATVRDQLARAGFNCKVGTDASYQDAKARFDDLQILIRGGSIETASAAVEVSWDKVADRAPLMERLEQAEELALAPWTANAQQFAAKAEPLAHEAQVVAALAAVIAREGYEYADDDTYLEYAGQLRAHALALRDAANGSDYKRARQAVGEISKTCTACHDGFRN